MHPDVVSSVTTAAPSKVTEQKPAKSETKSEVEGAGTNKSVKPQQEKPAMKEKLQEKPATKEKLPAPSVCINTSLIFLIRKGTNLIP